MHDIKLLFRLAASLDEAWAEREAIDWSEAEQLIRACVDIPVVEQINFPEICRILQYADMHDEWDSEEVAGWPERIQGDLLSAVGVEYEYRVQGEHWEVYSVALTGEEEWKANVETERLAIWVRNMLRAPSYTLDAVLNTTCSRAK